MPTTLISPKWEKLRSCRERSPAALEYKYLKRLAKHHSQEYIANNYVLVMCGVISMLAPLAFVIADTPFSPMLLVFIASVELAGIGFLIVVAARLRNKMASHKSYKIHDVETVLDIPHTHKRELAIIKDIFVNIPPHWHQHLLAKTGQKFRMTIGTNDSPYSVSYMEYKGAVTPIVATPFVLIAIDKLNITKEREAGFNFSINRVSGFNTFKYIIGGISAILFLVTLAINWSDLTRSLREIDTEILLVMDSSDQQFMQIDTFENLPKKSAKVELNNVYRLSDSFVKLKPYRGDLIMGEKLAKSIKVSRRRDASRDVLVTPESEKKLLLGSIVMLHYYLPMSSPCGLPEVFNECEYYIARKRVQVKGVYIHNHEDDKRHFYIEESAVERYKFLKERREYRYQVVGGLVLMLLLIVSMVRMHLSNKSSRRKLQQWYQQQNTSFVL